MPRNRDSSFSSYRTDYSDTFSSLSEGSKYKDDKKKVKNDRTKERRQSNTSLASHSQSSETTSLSSLLSQTSSSTLPSSLLSLNNDIDTNNDFYDDAKQVSKVKTERKIDNDYNNIFQSNLPLGTIQILLSIKNSEALLFGLHQKYENYKLLLVKTIEIDKNLYKISNDIINEITGLIALCEIIYGRNDIHVIHFYIELALAYLDCEPKPLAKQAIQHCEKAMSLISNCEIDKTNAKPLIYLEQVIQTDDERMIIIPPRIDIYHDMILNYVYGRSCTLLKHNDDGEKSLEKSDELFKEWKVTLNSKRISRINQKMKQTWKLKILYALAK
jgi:hypothetical protein